MGARRYEYMQYVNLFTQTNYESLRLCPKNSEHFPMISKRFKIHANDSAEYFKYYSKLQRRTQSVFIPDTNKFMLI